MGGNEKNQKHVKIISDSHKTGHYYDQEINIHQEHFPRLKRLREEFKKNQGYRAKLVFGRSLDTKDHSLAATKRKVLRNFLMKKFCSKLPWNPHPQNVGYVDALQCQPNSR